jgi:hypothetical protein
VDGIAGELVNVPALALVCGKPDRKEHITVYQRNEVFYCTFKWFLSFLASAF